MNNPNLPELLTDFVCSIITVKERGNLVVKMRVFVAKLRKKFKQHSRTYARLCEKEKLWLDGELYIEDTDKHLPGPGRPEKEWGDSSDRSKRRKVARYVHFMNK